MLKRDTLDPENLTAGSVSPSRLNALDSLSDDPLPILYQSGYLTLGDWDDMNNYYLRFPNEEVERGFLQALAQIEEKGYAAPYAADARKLFKLGVDFSTKSKQIDEWKAVEGMTPIPQSPP